MNRTKGHLRRRSRAVVALAAVAASVVAAAIGAPSASADVEWYADVYQAPTNLPPGGRGTVRIVVANVGDTAATEFPTVSFTLPSGVTIGDPVSDVGWVCTGSPAVTCTNLGLGFLGVPPHQFAGIGPIATDLNLFVDVDPGAAQGSHAFPVTLSGGGGAPMVKDATVRVDDHQEPFGPRPGSLAAGAFDQSGADYTQAGGHPYSASVSFDLNTRFAEPDPSDSGGQGKAIQQQGTLKDVVVDLPKGFIGDPQATPKCPDLGLVFDLSCPATSQVGVVTIAPPLGLTGRRRMMAIYNVEPPKDAPAQFAFLSPIGTVTLTPVLRSDGDMGISVQLKNTTQADVLLTAKAELWGVPADPSHDSLRCVYPNLYAQGCVEFDEGGEADGGGRQSPHSSNAPLKPFLTNPTACSGTPLLTDAHFTSWAEPGPYEPDGDPDLSSPRWVSAQATSPPISGCSQLAFDPKVRVRPTTTRPDSPTGLEFELEVPQNDAHDGLAIAHLRDTTVVLPEGMTVNPSSADGLGACRSTEIGLVSKSPLRFTKTEPSCPLSSKIGTVEVDTPLLEQPLTGDVFLARQADNPFDSLLAVYFVVRGPGLLVKLAGHVEADPTTGRLSTTVIDNPEVPFDRLRVSLKGGPRAPLSTPATCGPKTTTVALTSWAGHSVDIADSFAIDCPGNADSFAPGFAAGSTSTVAGSFSPFTARIQRSGGKELGSVDMTLPRGLLASLRNVTVCNDAQLAAAAGRSGTATQSSPACPARSQVGTTTAGAGSGPTPFFPTLPGTRVSGRVYLTNRFTGIATPAGTAPTVYGLAIEVPAVAGPFDLGTVLVRAAVFVDPDTAQVRVISEKLPRILQGIPLDVRDVRVDIDRPGFSTTPTSCAESKVEVEIGAQDGTSVTRSSRYQAGECAALGLAPRTSLTLVGRKQTKLGGHPALRVRLRQASGQSNLRTVRAVLPGALALDARNSSGDWLCSFEGSQRMQCPASSRIGTAKAWSPLLKRPLSGPVYFAKNVRVDPRTGNRIRTLPTLAIKLSGEAEVHVRATSDSRRGLLISTFSGLPDAKVSRFDLQLRGGARRGILAVSGGPDVDLCKAARFTRLAIRGQNGKLTRQRVRMKTPCAKKAGKAQGRDKRRR